MQDPRVRAIVIAKVPHYINLFITKHFPTQEEWDRVMFIVAMNKDALNEVKLHYYSKTSKDLEMEVLLEPTAKISEKDPELEQSFLSDMVNPDQAIEEEKEEEKAHVNED
jgi:hypothetical protein